MKAKKRNRLNKEDGDIGEAVDADPKMQGKDVTCW